MTRPESLGLESADLEFDVHRLPGVGVLRHKRRRRIRWFLIFGELTYRQCELQKLVFFHPDYGLPARTARSDIEGPLPRFADRLGRYRIYKSQVNALIFSQCSPRLDWVQSRLTRI